MLGVDAMVSVALSGDVKGFCVGVSVAVCCGSDISVRCKCYRKCSINVPRCVC